MIKFDFNGTIHPVAVQELKRPAVYLDHWAIRLFSEDGVLGSRFVTALNAKNGTWAISLLNFMEFVAMTDQNQAAQFETLLEQAIPNLFIIDFQAFDVIDRETTLLQGGSKNAPYGDVSFLKVFTEVHPDSPRPFTAKSLVTAVVQHRDRLAPALKSFQNTVMKRVRCMRDEMLADEQVKKNVDGSPKSVLDRPTLLFVRELIGTFLRDNDNTRALNDMNNATDLFHAVVPVAYCDFVLLDAAWVHRVGLIHDRLKKHEIEIEPAKVFSKKNIEDFLQQLEAPM